MQGRIQPVSLGGAVSTVKAHSRIHYCKGDELYFTTLLCQNNGWENCLKLRMRFSKLYNITVNKVTFVVLRRVDRPPPLDPPLHPCGYH